VPATAFGRVLPRYGLSERISDNITGK